MSFETLHGSPAAQAASGYTMREVRSVTRDDWNAWLRNSPGGGHVYQSYEWGEFKRRLGWDPVRLILEQNGEVVGLAQLLSWSTPFVPGKLMYATKGPWLPWEDKEAVRTFFAGVRTVAKREGVHTVKIEPEVVEEQTDIKQQLLDLRFHKFRWDLNYKTTMLMDLSPSEDDLLSTMKAKTRYNIRLAGKRGVRVVEDNSMEARERFWQMMNETAERDGFRIRRPHDYHFSVWQTMYDAGRAHLFFAEHEGERLAGMMIYTFGQKYWYMVGASTSAKRNTMPTYLLQWEVIRWAKEHGLTYYDMVAIPSPDNLNETDSMYGLYKFKVGFGGEIADFLGCYDLYVAPLRARAWNAVEPVYYRVYQRLKGDVYY